MQKNNSSKGTIIALIVIVIVSLGLYFYFEGAPSDADSSLENLSSIESVEAQAAANRVLSLLNQINSLRIDDSIFKSLVYQSLVDYTVAIPELPVGRANPFAPN